MSFRPSRLGRVTEQTAEGRTDGRAVSPGPASTAPQDAPEAGPNMKE
jgi:hypothetical protein